MSYRRGNNEQCNGYVIREYLLYFLKILNVYTTNSSVVTMEKHKNRSDCFAKHNESYIVPGIDEKVFSRFPKR